MSPTIKTVNVVYQGDEPCWTPTPSLNWEPREVKALSVDDAAYLLTNEMFKEVPPTAAPITTEVNVSG